MSSKKLVGDVKHDLLKNIAAYAATGIVGATIAFGVTELNRLPSRALTVLPAGIHVIEGPTISCNDAEFISARVNPYVDSKVRLPSCDVLLAKTQAADLVQALEAAKRFYQAERIDYFERAKSKLTAIAKDPPPSGQKLKESTLAAIGDLEFISAAAPRELDGPALLRWAAARVDTVLTDVMAEFTHIQSIVTALKGEGAQPARHTEFYFVATNASDVEFYISTACAVRGGGLLAGVVLEKVDHDDILSGALVYMPVLPGRGRLMKYSPRDERQVMALLSSKEPIELACTLASGRTIETKKFDPRPFVARESTFVSR